jgi:hypothetical protein
VISILNYPSQERPNSRAMIRVISRALLICVIFGITAMATPALAYKTLAKSVGSQLNLDNWFTNRKLPKVCSVVFKDYYDAYDQCPYSTPVIEVIDFWSSKSIGFACMCGTDPADALAPGNK